MRHDNPSDVKNERSCFVKLRELKPGNASEANSRHCFGGDFF
jgi:hypothetical protein